MSTRTKKILGAVAGAAVLGSSFFVAPFGADAQSFPAGYNPDPAHHSTDLNDPDPAHHRPQLVCPTSGTTCTLVPVAGFDLNGYPVGSGNGGETPAYPAGYSQDPAHHSTDLNDPDPAHHQPIFVYDGSTWVLTAIPGFDLSGNRI